MRRIPDVIVTENQDLKTVITETVRKITSKQKAKKEILFGFDDAKKEGRPLKKDIYCACFYSHAVTSCCWNLEGLQLVEE